ncbi:MAG: hypothetical protein DRP33_04270 [Thermotogae bacterium]|nr:MAG: hypothetical protein DRP33_04270 [Thermotogota bacterium]
MKFKGIAVTWIVVLAALLVSSCGINLLRSFDLDSLLSTGSTEEKLSSADEALNGGNYTEALALAGSVLSEELNLDIGVEDLKTLIDSTETLLDFADETIAATDLSEDAISALEIVVKAAAGASGKSLDDLADSLIEIGQDLGLDMGAILGSADKSVKESSDEFDIGEFIETSVATMINMAEGFIDGREILKLLLVGCHELVLSTPTADSSPMYAVSGLIYDFSYLSNLIIDLDDDGTVSDEEFFDNVSTNPASVVYYSQQATSGLYEDLEDSEEFVWAYDLIETFFGVLDIDEALPEIPTSTTLTASETIFDLFETLGSDAQ